MTSPKRLKRLLPTLALIGITALAQPPVEADPASGSLLVRVRTKAGGPLVGAQVTLSPGGHTCQTDAQGSCRISNLPPARYAMKITKAGFTPIKRRIAVRAGQTVRLALALGPLVQQREEHELSKQRPRPRRALTRGRIAASPSMSAGLSSPFGGGRVMADRDLGGQPGFNTEQYDRINENPFKPAGKEPLSTFSIDVDTASYSNSRRFIAQQHRLPPKDAVRIEEWVNYFSYDYPDARGKHPFSVSTELSACPWNRQHRLLLIGLQGKKMAAGQLPPMNLVFLLDVSGSMAMPNKLPLLKRSFKLLVDEMRPQDRVAIVVYAGAAGLVLPPTSGRNKEAIMAALERLEAGGSTAGGEGIRLAYQVAGKSFARGGNNRVILATDGDFNVGQSSDAELERLIEKKRKSGIYLTVLGLGTGNYKDSKMEKLADKGNGNYAYIDSILEAKKVLVTEMGATLLTIAKDVKLQIEFNPARVKAYRLIGYENRLLRAQDFNDDKKDAGELGAGHSVTALYEIIPAGSQEKVAGIDELKYQRASVTAAATASGELATVKLRYKPPKSDKSTLLSQPVADKPGSWRDASGNLRWASAVVEAGLLLRDSEHKGQAAWESVLARAKGALGQDPYGYRSEFLQLARAAQQLQKSK